MELLISEDFENELDSFKRGKDFKYEVFKRLCLLKISDGVILGQTSELKGHKPLKELKYKDVRIFYFFKSNTIMVVGILKKDRNKFSAKVLENLKDRCK